MNLVTMLTLEMKGPFELKEEMINAQIKGWSPGNYALGHIKGNAFVVKYVGRSDTDVNGRIKDWIGHYTHFKWSYASSEKMAYDKECRNYHDFGENQNLDVDKHPSPPKGEKWKCMVCGE